MKKFVLLVLVVGLFASTANAGLLITAIERRNSTKTAPIIDGPLVEGALAYSDRVHTLHEIPDYMIGADYIRTANDDRDLNNIELDVTVTALFDVTMYLFIDNRVGDNEKADPPAIGPNIMLWVDCLYGFVPTGDTVAIDENANGDINNYFTIYKKDLPAGTTITLYEQREGGLNMYGVAVVPEPATIALLGLGGLGLLRRKR